MTFCGDFAGKQGTLVIGLNLSLTVFFSVIYSEIVLEKGKNL